MIEEFEYILNCVDRIINSYADSDCEFISEQHAKEFESLITRASEILETAQVRYSFSVSGLLTIWTDHTASMPRRELEGFKDRLSELIGIIQAWEETYDEPVLYASPSSFLESGFSDYV